MHLNTVTETTNKVIRRTRARAIGYSWTPRGPVRAWRAAARRRSIGSDPPRPPASRSAPRGGLGVACRRSARWPGRLLHCPQAPHAPSRARRSPPPPLYTSPPPLSYCPPTPRHPYLPVPLPHPTAAPIVSSPATHPPSPSRSPYPTPPPPPPPSPPPLPLHSTPNQKHSPHSTPPQRCRL